MALRKTIGLLPEIFRTQKNEKFLNATVDQLVTPKVEEKLNAYIGRKFAPTYTKGDQYVTEPSDARQEYQLEPGVVYNNTSDNDGANRIEFLTNYVDMINRIDSQGGDVSDHDRIFENEYYTWSSFFDFDKFVNFSQYYWLPNGPDSVQVFSSIIDNEANFDFTRVDNESAYFVNGRNSVNNPTIQIARGGSYTFTVDQNDNPFYIQTEPGLDGLKNIQDNISTRDILGITNNGEDTGQVTFNVPQADAQNLWITMPTTADVDFATRLKFKDVNKQTFSAFIAANPEGLDGITEINEIQNTTIVFYNDSDQEVTADWESGGIFDENGVGYDTDVYDPTETVPLAERYDIYSLTIDANNIIYLNRLQNIPQNEKVFILKGEEFGNRALWKNAIERLEFVPVITAPLTRFFYQDGNDAERFGIIDIVEQDVVPPIDITEDILGRNEYIAPNAVEFTNGLKVEFNTDVTPSTYAGREFYVDGVGQPGGIRLTAVDELIVPEPYTTTEEEGFDTEIYDSTGYAGSANAPIDQDYFTINRSSKDRNAWSRSNRWFHIDVISITAVYNNFNVVVDQNNRANRPIIEMEPDLQLYKYGKIFNRVVTAFDVSEKDALSNVEGEAGFFVDGIPLLNGVTVIFSADEDPIVRSKIYEVSIVDPQGDDTEQIHLTEIDEAEINDVIIVSNGATKQGIAYYYDGSAWVQSQQKTQLNQAPFFDIFDTDGNSYSDDSVYFGTGFTGSKLFSYQQQPNVTEDPVLGFGLSYKNFENVGDIIFENNYVRDKFTYSSAEVIVTKKVNDGFVHKIIDRDTVDIKNDWTKVNRNSRQFKVTEYEAAATQLQTFQAAGIPKSETDTVNLFVYKNAQLLKRNTTQNITNFVDTDYTTLSQDGNFFVVLNEPATVGDQITIRVYTDQETDLGYYEVPANLENNALNEEFTTLTLGQVRNHITTTSNNSATFFGESPGRSNLRDVTNLKTYAGNILQHSAGAHIGAFLLDGENVNFKFNEKHVHSANAITSIDFGQKEYSKFKQKLYEAVSTLDLDFTNIPAALDTVIDELKIGKSETFPFFYSDMIGYGEDVTNTTYIVENPSIKTYDYGIEFDNTTVSNRSIIVYYNDEQLYLGQDYNFDAGAATITFADTFTLAVNGVIKIVDYVNTDGSFVPPTPSKMGLYPKYKPEIYTDNTFRTPKNVIQGHDGGIFVAFNDSRDDVILEFEKRVYNNIKTTYTNDVFDINEIMPGKFRATDYTREELDSILSLGFLQWAINNKVDYSAQTGFDVQDKFTWNWSNFQDKIDGELLPGHWRGIYRYFYDTDRPHTHPWEMLGLSEKPTWWDDRYGLAPYTSGNEVMWEDLRDAKLYQDADGETFTVLENYKRPDLKSILPVDENGGLASPLVSVVAAYNTTYIEESYVFGDVGPSESAWRRASEYPFAIMKMAALTRPSKFLFTRFDVDNISRNTSLDQIVDVHTLKRIRSTDLKLHGTTTATGAVNRVNGISQFLSDYARHRNVSLANITEVIENLSLQLVYRVAGYTDKTLLKVLAEQVSPTSTNKGIFVPDDDYEVILTKSAPIISVAISGVIVEKTANGWALRGYDTERPYFDIIPSQITDNSYQIRAGNESTTAVVYNDFRNEILRIPYNTEFTNKQQVVDFFVSYQRYLETQGFVFDEQLEDENDSLPKDWILSAKEFLFWQSQGWSKGSTLTLNPVSDKVKFELFGTIPDDIGGEGLNYKVLNQNLKPIRYNQLEISRVDNLFTIQANPNSGSIYLIEVNPVQYEHTIVFNNRTAFNDIIYLPELGSRQFRLKLIGTKTSAWDGTMQAPGYVFNQPVTRTWQAGRDYKKGDFVIFRKKTWVAVKDQDATQTFDQEFWKVADNIKTGLRPNLDSLSVLSEGFHDIDQQNNEDAFDRFGKGLIGYQKREYLENLELDDVSQVKFYQGMIKQKGTAAAIDKLIRAQLDNQDSDIQFFEEWGFRIGEYGAIDANQVVEVELDETRFISNPELIEFLNNGDTRPQSISYIENDLYKTPNEYDKNMFTNRSGVSNTRGDITNAGFARLEDVNTTIFDIEDINELSSNIDNVGSGYTVWTGRNRSGVWDIYRVSETFVNVVGAVDVLDDQLKFTTDINHNLELNDFVAIRNTDTGADGFYKITKIVSNISFIVDFQSIGIDAADLEGLLFKLVSIKYPEPKDIASFNPLLGWQTSEKVWLENDENGKWEVLQKQSPWDFSNNISYGTIAGSENLGNSFSASGRNLWAVAGLPNSGTGKAITYVQTATGDFGENSTQDPSTVTGMNGFGTSVSAGGSTYFVVGAPTSDSSSGYAVVYKKDSGNSFSVSQVLRPSGLNSGDKFGQTVTISEDENWIYVGATGSSKIYAYTLQEVISANETVETITGDGVATSYDLFWFPESEDNLRIIDDTGRILVPYVDYTISGNTVNFTFTLVSGTDYVARRVTLYRHISEIQRDTDLQDRPADALASNITTNDDGRVIVAGAPNRRYFGTDSSLMSNVGAAYVFERTQESFIGDASTKTYTPTGTLPPVNTLDVYVDDVVQIYTVDLGLSASDSQFGDYTTSGNSVVFRTAPASGTVVRINTNNFVQVQRLLSSDPTDSDQYGTTVAIEKDANWIAVGSPNEDRNKTNTGSVFVYVDQSRRYGTVTGTASPTIGIGDKIRINDVVVTTTSTLLSDLVNDINAAGISGITASGTDALTITSDRVIEDDKLRVMPLSGDTYGSLGVQPYAQAQEISHPSEFENESFGLVVDISRDGETLVIGSKFASTINEVRFDVDSVTDEEATFFDSNSTKFFDKELQSGAVYIYNLLASWQESVTDPAQFGYIQQLQSETIESFDEFGTSVFVRDDKIIVGSPKYDTTTLTDSGILYEYENPTRGSGWKTVRSEDEKVNVDLLNKAFVYDRRRNEILEYLDWIDPFKGKVSGLAQQELSYTVERDPAIYNVNSNQKNTTDSKLPWGDIQVGRLWWDVSRVRYLEYEQGSLEYRRQNWGAKFPSSSIDVYEWVESNELPSEYTGIGTPKLIDDSSYVERVSYNANTGNVSTKYYYWVKDKTTVPNNGQRQLDSLSVSRAIDNPKTYGLAYVALTKSNSVLGYNLAGYLDGKNTILHINYDVIKNANVLHSEYQLLAEGDSTSTIEDKIYNKFVDSLAGTNARGDSVPQRNLSVTERYGVLYRPRQTMFVNRAVAVELFVTFCNSVFETVQIANQFDLSTLETSDPIPGAQSGQWNESINTFAELGYLNPAIYADGYKVLILNDETVENLWTIYTKQSNNTWTLSRVQAYDTTNYWERTTWYADGFTANTVVTFAVETEPDLETIVSTLTDGDLVKIKSDDQGGESVVQYSATDNSFTSVVVENGTIRFKESLYDNRVEAIGFDNAAFDNTVFDKLPSTEIRQIVTAVKNDIFVEDIRIEWNRLWFTMVEYLLTEQPYADWLFKTSFIKVVQKLRGLDQYPNYQRDNQDYIRDYINEAKPYRTNIREYILDYTKNDPWGGDPTDFDVHSYFDTDLSLYRKPSGELASDFARWEQGFNIPWGENYKFSIGSVIILSSGSGYTIPPTITVTGGGGSGAVITAATNGDKIVGVTLVSGGSGYTSTPTATINGVGTGFKIYLNLTNGKVREADVTMKFDRYKYTSDIVEWTANTAYTASQIISYLGEAYQVNTAYTSGATFDASNLTVYADSNFTNAADRIAAYYTPTEGMVGKDINQLQLGTEYPGVRIFGPDFSANPGFDIGAFDIEPFDSIEIDENGIPVISGAGSLDTILRSSYTDESLGLASEDINIDGSGFVDVYNSHAPEEFVPGIMFDTLDLKVFTLPGQDQEFDGNAARIYTEFHVSDGSTTSFAYKGGSSLEDVDNIFVWTSTGGAQYEGTDFTVNYTTGLVNFTSSPASDAPIYIYSYSNTGEKPVAEESFVADGSVKKYNIAIDPSIVQQVYVLVDGVRSLNPIITKNALDIDITLTSIPALNSHVHIVLYDVDPDTRQAFSAVNEQVVTSDGVTKAITLDNPVLYGKPFGANIIVEVNGVRLRPDNAVYYDGDGDTTDFFIPSSAQENQALISNSDVSVAVYDFSAGQLVNYVSGQDYTLNTYDGSSVRSISLIGDDSAARTPSNRDSVIIGISTDAEYTVNAAGTVVTLGSGVSLNPGDKIRIISFGNHDPQRLQTNVFKGTGTQQKFTLDRVVTNTDYLWVTVDGVKLHSAVDYTVEGNTIIISDTTTLTSSSIIVVTGFTEDISQPATGFRIFKDMLNVTNYYRIARDNTTTLAQAFDIGDETMYVNDASILADADPIAGVPGFVMIEGERITYWSKDNATNTITRIRRSTSGTGARDTYPVGSNVFDVSGQKIPGDTHTKVWYTAANGNPSNGKGLQRSETVPAKFLVEKRTLLAE